MKPVVKIPGGKYYLYKWIIGHFPRNYPDLIYVEPCLGGGSVFLNKRPSRLEYISDIDSDLMLIWKELTYYPIRFIESLKKLSYDRKTFVNACEFGTTAEAEYVRRRMSRNGDRISYAHSDRKRRGMPENTSAWKSSIAQLPDVARRLEGVNAVYTRDLLFVLESFADKEDVFIYLDPPYLHSTRVTTDNYTYEMSDKQHEEMLKLLVKCDCKVLLSGYASDMYNTYLKDWKVAKKLIVNHASQVKDKPFRVEYLYRNY